MFWKLLNGLFETRLWKIIVVILSIFLFISFVQLVFVANQSINLTLAAVDRSAPSLRNYINSAYYNGILAILVFVFLAIVQITNIVRDYLIAQQYRALANTMLNFAEGKIAARYTENAAKEVTQLGLAFNSMADSLQRLIEELQNSEKRRQEIVANIAHDLAGPLTAISGYIETVARNIKGDNEVKQKEYLGIIKSNINTITRLVSELSDLSKFDVEDLPLQKDLFSLKVLAKDVISRYALEAENRKVKLTIDDSKCKALISADMHMIERLISNLIENAIYYTQEDGQVSASFDEDENFVSLKITDTGIGIPDEDLPFIFERFYRVDKDRSRKSGGSGLGLAIVKRIVELHKGSISISSVRFKGTIISIKLPASDEKEAERSITY